MKRIVYIPLFFVLISATGQPGRVGDETVMVPQLSVPWKESVLIIGDSTGPGKIFYSDFLLIKDKCLPARWHSIGIQKEGNTLYHAVSEKLTSDWRMVGDITSPDSIVRMWAPFAIWAPGGDKAYMYYHHGLGIGEMNNSMRVMISDGPGLDIWVNHNVYPEAAGLPGIRNVAFTGAVPRDACIFYDENLKKYMMYYAEDDPRAVMARVSDDALYWSDPVEVMSTPEPADAYVTPESPFVLYRDGLYYLFVSGFDYGRVALYISEDPFRFGHPGLNKIAEINGHAPEIVEEDGIYYIVSAHISTVPGLPPGHADLWGTYLQELVWRPALPEDLPKIFRTGN